MINRNFGRFDAVKNDMLGLCQTIRFAIDGNRLKRYFPTFGRSENTGSALVEYQKAAVVHFGLYRPAGGVDRMKFYQFAVFAFDLSHFCSITRKD